MSDLATGCYTSTGAVGRKHAKTRRYALREARRLGRLPAPSALERRFRPEKRAASEAAAA